MQACCSKTIEYVDRPYEVKVPVKCVLPKVDCNLSSTSDTEVLGKMMECISNHNHIEQICK
jgi:hypothetical protein